MKKLYSLLMIVLLAGLAAQAATNYGIKVAGVNVTSDNASGVTGTNISGSVTYNNSTKTLTMTNVTINLTSGSERALLNTGCSGLTVKFVGTCTLKTTNKAPIRSECDTYLYAPSSSSVVNVTGVNEGAIFMAGDNHTLQIVGPGKFNISTTKCPAIEGAESSGQLQSGYFVEFYDVTAELYSPENALRRLYGVKFHESSHITFKATNNADYSIATSIQGFAFFGNETVLAPIGAYASNSAGSFLDKDGNRIKYQDVYVSDNYAFIINATNFPDPNFKNYMLYLYPKGYVTPTEVQNLTNLDLHGLGMYDITGIEKMPYLKTLYCNNNDLTSLNLSSNTNLTYLSCYNNGMTSLNVNNCTKLTYLDCATNNLTTLNLSNLTALQTLYCNNNKLTSISFASSTPNLQTVNCSSNKFTHFNLYDRSALKTLNISYCPTMTILQCFGCALTSLNVTGNTALTDFDCYYNTNLSNITGLADCAATMEKFSCHHTAISNLDVANNMNNLNWINCYDTKLTSLTLTNKSKLTAVHCYNNPQMTTLVVRDNSILTTLYANNCSSLNFLLCSSNKLTTLSVTGCTALTDLRCFYNYNLTTITGLADCTALTNLTCNECAITSLPLSNATNIATIHAASNRLTSLSLTYKRQLKVIDVSYNTALTSLVCTGDALTTLNVTGCVALTQLGVGDNANLTAVTGLNDCTNITSLNLNDCNFSTLSVNNKTKLTTLKCNGNQLTSLNVSGCSALTTIECYKNKITGSGMNILVNSLPTRSASNPGTLRVIYHTGENNAMTAAQITTATNKYWMPKKYNGSAWMDLTATLRGDVNSDGSVTIADVTALIDLLLSGNTSGNDSADCNIDGSVNIADVTALIDYLLSDSW